MTVYGLDFTSVPSRRNPLVLVKCALEGTRLTLTGWENLPDFDAFEAFLRRPGPWIAGMDFPFGQPEAFLAETGWPPEWSGYMEMVARLGKTGFEDFLQAFQNGRPYGSKELKRETDRLCGAVSPMKLGRPAVAKMFFTGATRLLRSDANIVPCRSNNSDRVVVEAYPGVIARRLIGRQSYKGADVPLLLAARREMMAHLRSSALIQSHGVEVSCSDTEAEWLTEDPAGDRLDSLLCAIQAAWASQRKTKNYGIPTGHEKEGWIADPELFKSA